MPSSQKSFKWVRVVAFLLFATVDSSAVLAQQVIVLIERGASTYRQTADGFRNALAEPIDPEEIEVDEGGRLSKSIGPQSGHNPPDLIIAIGTRASRAATQQLHA